MKSFLRKFILTKDIYQWMKEVRDRKRYDMASNTEKIFIDRKKDCSKLCIILAGYKPFLYKNVFERLTKFLPCDIDVCVVSSGLYSDELAQIAEINGWSYLSIKRNCVTLAQNVAIRLHEKAEYIYKIDEDIFVTEGCFETLLETYEQVEQHGEYNPGIVAPIIPINGYGHMKILEKLGLKSMYKTKFEKPIYASYPKRMIENNGEVAQFFWGKDKIVPMLDELNKIVREDEFHYSICPIRFSIGFILFKRELWENMGMLQVRKADPCMGLDEEQICSYCIIHSKAIIVSENSVVGHLAFGQQNETMKAYYLKHEEDFALKS